MTVRMDAVMRRRLAGSVLGGFIAFSAVPAAKAQWAPSWRAAISTGGVAERLEAQGYVLIGPLQRRPGVYLADVRAGPGGFQRLVIDDRSGEILERFISPPRRFGSEYAIRYDEFGAPPPSGVLRLPPGPGMPVSPDGGQGVKSTNDWPANVRIPSAVSPFGSQLAPPSTKLKPKSPATARKTTAPGTAPALVTPPLPPPAPREAVKPDGTAPAAPISEPKSDSPLGDTENASAPGAPPMSEGKPGAPTVEPQAQTQATVRSLDQPPETGPAPASPPETGDKSKVSIVPPALFE